MENKEKNVDQIIILNNRKNLSVSGTIKIISLKPDLIQLDTTLGGLIISGNNLELVNLDNETTQTQINGNINSIKYTELKAKESFIRKIFK